MGDDGTTNCPDSPGILRKTLVFGSHGAAAVLSKVTIFLSCQETTPIWRWT